MFCCLSIQKEIFCRAIQINIWKLNLTKIPLETIYRITTTVRNSFWRPPPCILRKSFAYPDLLISMIDNINSQNHIHPDFKDAIFFSLLSVFSDVANLRAFLTSGMPTFSGKVRSIFLSDVSKHWKLRDLADYLYMSESLIKKKLLLENTSFSKILLDTRMSLAIKLLKQNHPIKYVSEMCGFSSTSYFVCLFRQYYECTPRKYLKH